MRCFIKTVNNQLGEGTAGAETERKSEISFIIQNDSDQKLSPPSPLFAQFRFARQIADVITLINNNYEIRISEMAEMHYCRYLITF